MKNFKIRKLCLFAPLGLTLFYHSNAMGMQIMQSMRSPALSNIRGLRQLSSTSSLNNVITQEFAFEQSHIVCIDPTLRRPILHENKIYGIGNSQPSTTYPLWNHFLHQYDAETGEKKWSISLNWQLNHPSFAVGQKYIYVLSNPYELNHMPRIVTLFDKSTGKYEREFEELNDYLKDSYKYPAREARIIHMSIINVNYLFVVDQCEYSKGVMADDAYLTVMNLRTLKPTYRLKLPTIGKGNYKFSKADNYFSVAKTESSVVYFYNVSGQKASINGFPKASRKDPRISDDDYHNPTYTIINDHIIYDQREVYWLSYNRGRSDQYHIFIHNIKTKKESRLTWDSGPISCPPLPWNSEKEALVWTTGGIYTSSSLQKVPLDPSLKFYGQIIEEKIRFSPGGNRGGVYIDNLICCGNILLGYSITNHPSRWYLPSHPAKFYNINSTTGKIADEIKISEQHLKKVVGVSSNRVYLQLHEDPIPPNLVLNEYKNYE